MKLTAKVKLNPTDEQHRYLLQTLETTNAACNEISGVAWVNQTFNQYGLQKLVYKSIRESTGLTAQVVVRAISKVADAYKLDKETRRAFKQRGGIAYDAQVEETLDALADHLETHLDLDGLLAAAAPIGGLRATG